MAEETLHEHINERLADVIAACWIKLRHTEGFVRDSLDEVLSGLRAQSTPWAPLNVSEEGVWDALKKRFGAVEYPWGVLNFNPSEGAVAVQRRDALYGKFPRLVEVVENVLPKLA